jgi:hypothetical protein
MTRLIHVVPAGDCRAHQFHGTCWCHPTKDGALDIWVHRAADCREKVEEYLGIKCSDGWTLEPEYIIPPEIIA